MNFFKQKQSKLKKKENKKKIIQNETEKMHTRQVGT